MMTQPAPAQGKLGQSGYVSLMMMMMIMIIIIIVIIIMEICIAR